MGVGLEDVVAVKALETGIVPPVPNFKELDPELGALNLSQGGAYPVRYALRLAAGFGSQISMMLLRWMPLADGRHRAPDELGFAYRIVDPAAWQAWLRRITGRADRRSSRSCQRRLRVVDDGPAVDGRRPPRPSAPPSAVATLPPPVPWRRRRGRRRRSPRPLPPVRGRVAPVASAPAPVAVGDEVAARVLALVAEQTGYPPEMLDLDLDLEADLGVDTVKQAEMFAAVREAYGIERDDQLKLRDYPTLQPCDRLRPRPCAGPSTAAVAAARRGAGRSAAGGRSPVLAAW